jgi:hypothetical protein
LEGKSEQKMNGMSKKLIKKNMEGKEKEKSFYTFAPIFSEEVIN